MVHNEQQLDHITGFRGENVRNNLALPQWRFVPTAITFTKTSQPVGVCGLTTTATDTDIMMMMMQ